MTQLDTPNHWLFHIHINVAWATFIISQDLYSVVKTQNMKRFYDLAFVQYIVHDS